MAKGDLKVGFEADGDAVFLEGSDKQIYDESAFDNDMTIYDMI